jgi:Protein of unknown function (DUF2568)
VRSLRAFNLTVRFGLELCLLAAFAYWGAHQGGPVGIVLATASVAATVVVWWLFVAPKAPRLLPRPQWISVQTVLFGLGAAALWSAGSGALGIGLLVGALVNLALVIALGDAPS